MELAGARVPAIHVLTAGFSPFSAWPTFVVRPCGGQLSDAVVPACVEQSGRDQVPLDLFCEVSALQHAHAARQTPGHRAEEHRVEGGSADWPRPVEFLLLDQLSFELDGLEVPLRRPQPDRHGVPDSRGCYRWQLARWQLRRLIDRVDLYSLGLDVPLERQLALEILEPSGFGAGGDAVVHFLVVRRARRCPRCGLRVSRCLRAVRVVLDDDEDVKIALGSPRRRGPLIRRPRFALAECRGSLSVGRCSSRASVARSSSGRTVFRLFAVTGSLVVLSLRVLVFIRLRAPLRHLRSVRRSTGLRCTIARAWLSRSDEVGVLDALGRGHARR